jgi:hypothetical protein
MKKPSLQILVGRIAFNFLLRFVSSKHLCFFLLASPSFFCYDVYSTDKTRGNTNMRQNTYLPYEIAEMPVKQLRVGSQIKLQIESTKEDITLRFPHSSPSFMQLTQQQTNDLINLLKMDDAVLDTARLLEMYVVHGDMKIKQSLVEMLRVHDPMQKVVLSEGGC